MQRPLAICDTDYTCSHHHQNHGWNTQVIRWKEWQVTAQHEDITHPTLWYTSTTAALELIAWTRGWRCHRWLWLWWRRAVLLIAAVTTVNSPITLQTPGNNTLNANLYVHLSHACHLGAVWCSDTLLQLCMCVVFLVHGTLRLYQTWQLYFWAHGWVWVQHEFQAQWS